MLQPFKQCRNNDTTLCCAKIVVANRLVKHNLYGGRKHQFSANWKKREFTLKVAFSLLLPLSKQKLPIIAPKSGVYLGRGGGALWSKCPALNEKE